MRTRTSIVILSLIAVSFLLTGCSFGKNGGLFHKHNFVGVVTAPTCTEQGFTTYTCECGESYVDNYIDALGHKVVVEEAVAPTCSKLGYSEHQYCSVCNVEIVKKVFILPTGHSFTNYVYNNDVNCLKNGTETAVCDNEGCQAKDTRIAIKAPGSHSFVNYVYNNDATCLKNGTETAVCDNEGCQATDTREAKNTKLDHAYGDWYSNGDGKHTRECTSATPHSEIQFCKGGTKTCAQKAICEICNTEYGTLLPHPYESVWDYNETHHWHNSTCGCNARERYEEHTLDNTGICTVCHQGIRPSDGIYYDISEDGTYAMVIAYLGTSTRVNIASTYEGLPVTNIYANAFENSSLTTIVIPSSVTSIGEGAFSGCSNLTSVTIGNGITSIGSNAFSDCSRLSTVNFIGTTDEWAQIQFANAYSNPIYYANKLYINSALLTNAEITSATSISAYAFYNCNNLTSVEIGDSVTSVGDKAFYNCSSLTLIVIPDSVTLIGKGVFRGCNNLREITLPFVGASPSAKGYQSVFGYIFDYNTVSHHSTTHQYQSGSTNFYYYIPSSLKKVTITGGSINSYAFRNCSNLTSIVIPKSTTSIGKYSFWCCENLTSIIIPNSVTSIEVGAFSSCSKLTSITVPNSVNYIGDFVFNNCISLIGNAYGAVKYLGNDENPYLVAIGVVNNNFTSYELHDEVKFLVSDLFSRCERLTKITIPSSIIQIGSSAFNGCGSLIEVNYLGNIDDWAEIEFGDSFANPLYYTRQLKINGEVVTEVNLTTATKVLDYAFYGCGSLTSVVIGDSVASIGSSAFYNCSSLTSIVIPNSVTSIGDYAFCNCYRLVEVINKSSHITVEKCKASNGMVGYYAVSVSNCDDSYVSKLSNDNGYIIYTEGEEKILVSYVGSVTDVILPSYITKINQYALSGCSSLTSVEIGDSVTTIGEWSFSDCSSLISVIIPDLVISIGFSAFRSCSSLTEITLPFIGAEKDGVSNTHFGYIFGAYDYYDNNAYVPISLKKVTITSDSIGWYAFYDCDSLTSVVIGDSVTSIGNGAFGGCGSLQFNVKDKLKYLGNEENPYLYLAGVTSKDITSVNIDSNCRFVGSSAFNSCSSLISVVIPDSVISIGSSAFSSCSSLTSVEIPNSVTSIGSDAFYGCSSLTSVVIPNSVTSIGTMAFDSCSSLTTVVIPDSVISIEIQTFCRCSSLTTVVIPDSVISIGDNAFRFCSSLKYIYYSGTRSQWNAISKGDRWNDDTGNYTITYNYNGK